MTLLSACSRTSIKEGAQTVGVFIQAIRDGDIESLKKIISPSGLIVIRNFSSGYGTRGKDIRKLFSSDSIPPNLQFAVADEDPIDLHWLFDRSQQADVGKLAVRTSTPSTPAPAPSCSTGPTSSSVDDLHSS